MNGNDREEYKVFIAVVYHTVGVTLGAVVANSGFNAFLLAVKKHIATAAQKINDLAVGLVLVLAYSCAGYERTVYDLIQTVVVNNGAEEFFSALKVWDILGLFVF